MSKVALIVTTKTQPGKRNQVRELFEKHLGSRAMANKDQEVIIWCDDLNNPDTFYLFEIYSSQEAFQANSQPSEWFMSYMQEAGPLLDGQGSMLMAAPRWAKGVSI